MKRILFIGNCQTLSLCFYFQQLVKKYNNEYIVSWVLYGNEFKPILEHEWTKKCQNIIIDQNESFELIKTSDVIIYQEIKKEQKERSENKPDGLRSGVLSPSTVYGHPLCSVTLPSAPSTQPRVRGEGVRCGGIMPLIEYYRKLSEEGANGVKPLIEYYNKLSEGR